jgi:signal transduction histidine kinase
MRRFSLRTNQVLLVIGTALPLIVLAVWLSTTLIDYNQKTLAAGAINRMRAFMSAVDAELRGGIALLQALAVSERLGSDDLRGFHREATRFLKFQPEIDSIRVALPDGQQVMNTSVPFGQRLPGTYDRKTFDKLLVTQAPVTGDLVLNPSGTYTIDIGVPVLRNGKIAYVLSASMNPETFARLIDQQQLQPGWVSGLVDSEGRFIARKPARPPGDLASKGFMTAVAAADEGWYRGRTVEGLDTFTAHLKSDFSRWSVGLGIPAGEAYAAASRAGWLMAIGFITSLGLAFAFAYWMGRRISSPISSLAAAARSLGEASAPPLPTDSDITEVADLASTLKEAALAVRERHQLLEREKASLQATDRAKDEFLAMLSHELRNPLAVLTTSVHILRIAKPGDELTIKAQAVIERQLKQMTRLIEDLLDVSRVTMGKASLRREVFDLADLVTRVIAAWHPAAQDDGRKVALTAQRVWIDADRSRIEQVLINLLDNAQKFSPPDKQIRVSVARVNDEAVLTVADEGEGIDPEMLERVFGLFVQGPQGPDRARGGMGVGLALVKRLTEMHDGTVRASSGGAGTGAAFTVSFAAVARPADEPPALAGPRNPNAKRILVIEDNPDGREMLRASLALDGHEVHIAADGMTGINLYASCDPDIVLIDIGLPDIDGYEVAQRLRADRKRRHVALIAMTGYGQLEDERLAADAGFDLHLIKPVTAEQLRQALGALEGVS